MRAGISLGAAQTAAANPLCSLWLTSNINTGDTEACRDSVLAGFLTGNSIGTTS
jgi:hypothetical protein